MPDGQIPRNLSASLFLDTPPEESLDRLTWLVSNYLNVPVSLISVLDVDRQFFKSAVGLPEPLATTRETPLSHSFCKHVVLTRQPLVVNDAREHELVKDNQAIPDYGVIAYAGVPITDESGEPFAALCAVDTKPRTWSEEDVKMLGTIAAHVKTEVTIRERLRKMGIDLEQLRRAEVTRKHVHREQNPDLRTPLEAVLINLQELTDAGSLNAKQKGCLEDAAKNMRAAMEAFDHLSAVEKA